MNYLLKITNNLMEQKTLYLGLIAGVSWISSFLKEIGLSFQIGTAFVAFLISLCVLYIKFNTAKDIYNNKNKEKKEDESKIN